MEEVERVRWEKSLLFERQLRALRNNKVKSELEEDWRKGECGWEGRNS